MAERGWKGGLAWGKEVERWGGCGGGWEIEKGAA